MNAKKVYYQHFARCAGKSVTAALKDQLVADIDQADVKFTIVRNPYDRIASIFRVFNERRFEGANLDWILHVTSQDTPEGLENRRGEVSDVSLWHQTRPMSSLLLPGLKVFKLEDIKSVWCEAELWVGVPTDFPHLNIGRLAPSATPGQRHLIAELYAADFEQFGYQK